MNFWESILQASGLQKGLFLVLAIFSFFSWMLYFYYRGTLKSLFRQDRKFETLFEDTADLESIVRSSKRYNRSLFGRLFMAVHDELMVFVKRNGGKQGSVLKSREDLLCLERVFDVSLRNEISKLSHSLRWVATVASTAPFIGLLGTVVGIIRAFTDIGRTQSANLATVAPGIAEALIMTAVGLSVAIPAVVFFNDIKSGISRRQEEANRFGAHMINSIQKSFYKNV